MPDLSRLKAQYLAAGDDEAGAKLQGQLDQFEVQLDYVRTNPIQIAYIKVVSTPTQVRDIVGRGTAAVAQCGAAQHTPASSGKRSQGAGEGSVGIQSHYAQWVPKNGTISVNDTTENSGPYIRHFMNWDNISGFTDQTPGYEHDTKIKPWGFTECRQTMYIASRPWVDCEGPWSTTYPTSADPYMDTRWSDDPDVVGKDFTLGVGLGKNLQTNTTYTTTVFTNLASSSYSTATINLTPQLARKWNTVPEGVFCGDMAGTLGWYAACYFTAEEEQPVPWKSFTVQRGLWHENWFNWTR